MILFLLTRQPFPEYRWSTLLLPSLKITTIIKNYLRNQMPVKDQLDHLNLSHNLVGKNANYSPMHFKTLDVVRPTCFIRIKTKQNLPHFRGCRTSLTSEAVSSIESSFSPTPLKGGAQSVGEAVLAGLNTELKNLFRMLALSRMSVSCVRL